MIFIRYPFHCNFNVVEYGNPVQADRIKEDIGLYLGCNEFSLLHNERKLQDDDVIPNDSTVHVLFSLPGGKGGFGSMLRAIGAQIEKTTNREACRDLSGRRLRDINEEQRLKKWIAKEAEREAEKIKRRQARIERLKTKAPHKFFDFEYEKEISELPDRINEALSEGLQKSKQSKKRPHEQPEASEAPKKSWLADDFSSTSSDSDSDERNAAGEGSSKKLKSMLKESSSCDSDMSESSQPYPTSSKDSSFTPEESLSSEPKSDFRGESNTSSNEAGLVRSENIQENPVSISEINAEHANEKEDSGVEQITNICKDTEKKYDAAAESSGCTSTKKPELKDDSPIDLLDFHSASELEALGLDKLKSALIARGLKCGGNLSDRAQRLWKVRGLQTHEYPSNLLAKNKK